MTYKDVLGTLSLTAPYTAEPQYSPSLVLLGNSCSYPSPLLVDSGQASTI